MLSLVRLLPGTRRVEELPLRLYELPRTPNMSPTLPMPLPLLLEALLPLLSCEL